jgi:hypothetical protein
MEVSLKAKPPFKHSGQYKTRQLKWQDKLVCRYDEEEVQ